MGEMREELEKAFAEEKPVVEKAPAKEESARAEEQPKREEPKSEAAKEEVKEGAEPVRSDAAPKAETKDPKPDTEVAAEEPAKAAEPPKIKPPASWKAGAKERWNTLHPEIQEEVARRERESAIAIQRGAEAATFAEQFHKTIAPYQSIIAAEGAATPLVAVQNLLQTATTLRLGTPIQKADLVARLIKIYGVDVSTLDSLLSGEDDPQIKQQTQFDQMLNEKLSPLQQELQQYRQMFGSQQQQIQQQAAAAVNQFAEKNEFVDDPEIANDMADLLEVAAKRGRTLTIQEAYDRAVAMHPTISKIAEQRKAASNAQSLAAKRAAASSVSGAPMGGPGPPDPNDMRATIMAAMER